MGEPFSPWGRFYVMPWLLTMGLLVSACKSPQQSPVFQDKKAVNTQTLVIKGAQSLSRPRKFPEIIMPHERDNFKPPRPIVGKDSSPSLNPYLYKKQDEAVQMPLPESTTVRVALLLPLSGPSAKLGADMQNAAQLAMFAFADDRFELLIHDTKGTPEGSIDAIGLAIGDGARLVLGPLLRTSVRAVAPAARAANVTVVAFSSDKTVAGQGVFTMGFYPEAEVERVVGFARSRGITRYAVLAPDDEGGKKVVDTLQQVADFNGAIVSRIQFYDPNAKDFSAVVRRLANYDERRKALLDQKAKLEEKSDEISKRALERLDKLQTLGDLPFDALLLADGGKRLQAVAALLPFYDIDPGKIRILGTGRWDVSGLGAEPALVGGWFAAPLPKARSEYEAQYQEVYGKKPHRLSTLAYDATALAAVMARAEGGADFSSSALTVESGFFGRDGIFRFRDEGYTERGLAVLKVLRRGFKVIDQAPETFDDATN